MGRFCKRGHDKEETGVYAKDYCKVCHKENIKRYMERSGFDKKAVDSAYQRSAAGKATNRRSRLKNVYGLSEEEYVSLSQAQGHLCAICRQPELSPRTLWLSVDHCHKTGKVRGLLCHRCNTSIGKFEDSIELLQSAIRYLIKHEEDTWSTPQTDPYESALVTLENHEPTSS